MRTRDLGSYVIAGLVTFHILLWLIFTPPAGEYPKPTLHIVAEMFSSTGILLMACALVLSNKPRVLEQYFGGLDRMYVAHRTVALSAVILIVIHQMIVPNTPEGGPGVWLGWVAFFCIIFVVMITVGPRVPLLSRITGFTYAGWRKIHRFMGVFFIIGVVHMLMVEPMILHSPVLAVWILSVETVGIGAYLYKQFLWKRLRPYKEYSVEQINKLNGTTLEIRMKSKSGDLGHRAGQFLFVHFDGDPLFTEPHPFTISSAPGQDEVILSVKASGDWTGHLHQALKAGATAYVDGPYGMFNYKTGGQNQVWIAGGIGITPFLSWMRDFSGGGAQQIDFFYSVAHPGEGLFVDEVQHAAEVNPRFKPHISYSSEHGRLSVARIVEASGPISGKDVYLCGPIAMILAFRGALVKQGVPARNIHYEEFNFR